MTIAASGALRTGALRTEYGGSTPMRLGDYRRGHTAGWVKAKAANNNAVNMSGAVGTSVMRMGQFRGQAKGFTYTNTTTRVGNATNGHYHCHAEFGDDWTTSSWPCFYINNAVMGSEFTGYYALVIYGRSVGPFTFTNASRIEGAGGQPNSGAGQHAVYIYNTFAAFKPVFINNAGGLVRGGGGAGGIGGTGGTGGPTHYIWYEPGPTNGNYSYARSSTAYRIGSNGQHAVWWGGTLLYAAQASPGWPWVPAPGNVLYTYGTLIENSYPEASVNYNGYSMRRQIGYDSGYGGAGGGGGNGGRGQGYNSAQASGVLGALGAAGWAVNQAGNLLTGSGGRGGTGGTGGTWGNAGGTGNTGATGNTGTSSVPPGPTAGAGGAAGGAGGYAVYAAANCPWTFTHNGGSYNGIIGGETAPS